MQALNAEFEEASTPLADGLGRSPDPFGHCPVGEALGTGQDHAGSQDQAVRQTGGTGDSLELMSLLVAEYQGGKFASAGHRQSPF